MAQAAPQLENTFTTWRIADGVLKTGRGKDGDMQLPSICGKLLRFGFFEGESQDTGDKYAQVEVDLEDADGERFRVKASVKQDGKSSNVSAVGLMMGLLKCNLHDDIAIYPKRAEKPDPKYGVFATFVTVGIQNPLTGRYLEAKVNRDDFPGANSREKFPAVLEELKRHDCYAEREVRAMDEDGEEAPTLCAQVIGQIQKDGNWPDPNGPAKPTYLKLFGEIAGDTFGAYADISDTVWNEILAGYKEMGGDVPPDLAPFVADESFGLDTPASPPKKAGFKK